MGAPLYILYSAAQLMKPSVLYLSSAAVSEATCFAPCLINNLLYGHWPISCSQHSVACDRSDALWSPVTPPPLFV